MTGVAAFSMLCVPYGGDCWTGPDHWIDDWHYERISRGALATAIRKRVELWVMHDERKKIGDTTDGVLTLRDAPNGLYADVVLPDTYLGNQTRSELAFQVLSGASISYTGIRNATRARADDGRWINLIHQIDNLHEVSLVNDPAYQTFIFDFRSLRY
jgi:HK97 family phage prohead protease